ncbi:cation:proton antiporter [Patescibacteria group bacterium]
MEFAQIAVLFVVAGVFGVIARRLKQPLLIGYLFAGIFLGLTGWFGHNEYIEPLGKIGITLLLFLLGLEINIREIPTLGKVSLITGIGQIVFTSLIGFLIATLLGFDTLPSVYIAISLTFSSTIIMVKLLGERNDLSSLYGKIAIGFLLVQDFVAILILMFLASLGSESTSVSGYLWVFLKAIILFSLVWYLSKRILPRFFDKYVAHSAELLFVVSIAWALGVAAFVAGPMGFTLEIGGFLAGLALSNLSEHTQIETRTKPLRDFFLVIFFLLLGMQLIVGTSVIGLILPAAILSTFVLIGNPIIVLIILGLMGYRKRTGFLAGLTVAQISEFSFILMAMGLTLSHVTDKEVSLVVIVGVLTMTISTYLILGADKVYEKVKGYLDIFERKNLKELAPVENNILSDHVILVGADNTGKKMLTYLQKNYKDRFIVVDFNPTVFNELTANGYPAIFGDINDTDIIQIAGVARCKMIISTIDERSNQTLLSNIKSTGNRPITVMTATTKPGAGRLYEAGATYVLVPEMVAGVFVKHLIKTYGTNQSKFSKLGLNQFKRLFS